MALKIQSPDPDDLLHTIVTRVQKSQILTWAYFEVESTVYFTLTQDSWYKKAYLKANTTADALRMEIVWPANSDKELFVAAAYHGKFAEMVIAHFYRKITSINMLPPFDKLH